LLKGLEILADRYVRDGLMADWPMHPRQHAYQAAKSRETELHQLVGTADKKFSYHKQIAHQHSWSTVQKSA